MTQTSGSIESRVLSAAVRLNKIDYLTTRLREEHFTGVNRKVFNYLLEKWSRHKAAPSFKFLREKFPTFEVASPKKCKDFEYLIEELSERATTATVAGLLRESATMLSRLHDEGKVLEVLDFLESKIRIARSLSMSGEAFKMKERAGDFITNDYKNIVKMDGMLGIPFGIEALDGAVHGMKDGELIALLAFAGEGKTYLSLLISGLLWQAGYNVAFFSLEMDAETVARRLYAVMAGVSVEDYLSGVLSDEEVDRIEDFAQEASTWDAELILDDDPILTNSMMKSKLHEYGVDVGIVDYLTLMQGDPTLKGHIQFDELVKGAKLVARELGIPILVNAQGTKDSGESKIPPKLSQVGGGMPLSKHTDVVISFCRIGPNYTIAIRKNRNALLQPTIRLVWSLTDGTGLLCESTIIQDFNTDI